MNIVQDVHHFVKRKKSKVEPALTDSTFLRSSYTTLPVEKTALYSVLIKIYAITGNLLPLE